MIQRKNFTVNAMRDIKEMGYTVKVSTFKAFKKHFPRIYFFHFTWIAFIYCEKNKSQVISPLYSINLSQLNSYNLFLENMQLENTHYFDINKNSLKIINSKFSEIACSQGNLQLYKKQYFLQVIHIESDQLNPFTWLLQEASSDIFKQTTAIYSKLSKYSKF